MRPEGLQNQVDVPRQSLKEVRTLKNILELENYNDYVIIALAKLEGRFQGFANPMPNKQSNDCKGRYHVLDIQLQRAANCFPPRPAEAAR